MDTQPDYGELARELTESFARLGRSISPRLRNTVHGEAVIMRILDEAADPLTPGELAARAHVSSARVANVLRALEERGWVSRAHALEDRRRVEVRLTDAGCAAVAERREQRDREAEAFLSQLGERDTRELIRIMDRMAAIAAEGGERA